MKTSTVKALALAALVTLAGCTAERAHTVSESNPYLSQGRVQFESLNIKYNVQVARVDSKRLNGGLLKVYLTLRNTTREPVWIDIRTTFLDEDGHKLNDQTNWEPFRTDPRAVSEYTCTSMNPAAADYQIVVRNPRKPK